MSFSQKIETERLNVYHQSVFEKAMIIKNDGGCDPGCLVNEIGPATPGGGVVILNYAEIVDCDEFQCIENIPETTMVCANDDDTITFQTNGTVHTVFNPTVADNPGAWQHGVLVEAGKLDTFAHGIGVADHTAAEALVDSYVSGKGSSISASVTGNTLADNETTFAEGGATRSEGDASHTEGIATYSSGTANHVEGIGGFVTSGDANHVEGDPNEVDGNFNHVEGEDNEVSGDVNHVEGQNNEVDGGNLNHIEGFDNYAEIELGHGQGAENYVGYISHVEGTGNGSFATWCHTEGVFNFAVADICHHEGGFHEIDPGASTVHVEGDSNVADDDEENPRASHLEGFDNETESCASHMQGEDNDIDDISPVSHVEGRENRVRGSAASYTTGYDNLTLDARASHVEGENNETDNPAPECHVEGYGNYCEASTFGRTHVEGESNMATTSSCHVEGYNNDIGDDCHIEGANNSGSNAPYNSYCHVEGNMNTGNSFACHVEGFDNIARTIPFSNFSSQAHVEGSSNIADDSSAGHCEGFNNEVRSDQAHCEGEENIAAGTNAHCEGWSSSTGGSQAHASGRDCTCNGANSSAMGRDCSTGFNANCFIWSDGTGGTYSLPAFQSNLFYARATGGVELHVGGTFPIMSMPTTIGTTDASWNYVDTTPGGTWATSIPSNVNDAVSRLAAALGNAAPSAAIP